MSRFFVPYCGSKPAAISVNGHRLLILAKEKISIEEELSSVGADSLKTISVGNSKEEENRALNKLAKKMNAGVVIASEGLEVRDIIRSLESQLPWVQ